MAMGSGLLALAMVAAEGPSCPPVETTTYQVRVLTLDGLDWRTSSYSRLQPVARQGTSMIWTADRALAASLAGRAKVASPAHSIVAVGEAEITKAEVIHYVAAMDRVADGPMNQSSAIAFLPRPEQVEERFSIRVEGRKLDQGILTRIALEESHIDVIHQVTQVEALKRSPGKAGRTPAEVGSEILKVVLTPESAGELQKIATSIQIPEVTRAKVEGEWLIPNDGVLLVSLGIKTAADDKGMAVVRERVAVIEACSGPMGPAAKGSTFGVAQGVTRPDGRFAPVADARPALPSRSLPQPVDPNGNLVDLPPLPEALASADLDRIKPEPNQPSPQAPGVAAAPSVDPALARTGYDAAPPAPTTPALAREKEEDGDSIRLSEIMEGLAKAGVNLVVDVEPKDLSKAIKAATACEKCDGDSTFCPADARSMKARPIAGGIELAPEGPTVFGAIDQPQLGITVRDASGAQVADAGVKMRDVFKTPGKTETTIIPFGGAFSLEVKATLVPTSPEKAKAVRKAEAPATRR